MSDSKGQRIGRFGEFIDHDDGTVTDTRTGLMWMRCALGQTWNGSTCVGLPDYIRLKPPLASPITWAGYNDWRLPHLEELQGLVNPSQTSPVIDTKVFPNTRKNTYWTSSPNVANRDHIWQIDFGSGKPLSNLALASAYIRLVRRNARRFALTVTSIGAGNGIIVRNVDTVDHLAGSCVTLAAYANQGYKFKCWHGDASGQDVTCTVTMDSAKTISAEFSLLEYFDLTVESTGTGSGIIARSPKAEKYVLDSRVSLTAQASVGSKFKCWHGDVRAQGTDCTITMNSCKKISAEFVKIESFTLACAREGSGDGSVNWEIQQGETLQTPEVTRFIEGSVATLTATPSEGSKFKCWHGDVTGVLPTCTITFASSKSITAEFVQREFFALSVTTVGTGSGAITQSPDFEEYAEDSTVTLTAEAEEGSIFNGWQGDAAGMDARCTLAMDSAKRVTADFMKLDVSDLGIEVRFDAVEDAHMKNGEDALIFYFSVANNEPKQVRVELPLASYVTGQGEEIEQSVWLNTLLMGNKGSTLRAGTFRKMGLVFYKSRLAEVTSGDDLHITVLQAKPARRLGFTFRCTDQELRQFSLIKTGATLTHALDENGETSLEKLEILQRLTLLEDGMRDILQRLDALQLAPAPVHTNTRLEPTRTLPEVLAWLATQSRISVATLRAQLLPLDLLPNALIDDINERAYDLAGEAALDDDGDAVTVQRDVLLQVLTAWDE